MLLQNAAQLPDFHMLAGQAHPAQYHHAALLAAHRGGFQRESEP